MNERSRWARVSWSSCFLLSLQCCCRGVHRHLIGKKWRSEKLKMSSGEWHNALSEQHTTEINFTDVKFDIYEIATSFLPTGELKSCFLALFGLREWRKTGKECHGELARFRVKSKSKNKCEARKNVKVLWHPTRSSQSWCALKVTGNGQTEENNKIKQQNWVCENVICWSIFHWKRKAEKQSEKLNKKHRTNSRSLSASVKIQRKRHVQMVNCLNIYRNGQRPTWKQQTNDEMSRRKFEWCIGNAIFSYFLLQRTKETEQKKIKISKWRTGCFSKFNFSNRFLHNTISAGKVNF